LDFEIAVDDPRVIGAAWVGEAEGIALALVHGLDPFEALRIMCPEPAAGPGTVRQMWDWALDTLGSNEYGTALVARQVGEWTLLEEFNGYQTSRPELLEQLSRGTRAGSLYVSVNADANLMWAEDGVVTRSFDPLVYDRSVAPQEMLRGESRLPFGDVRLWRQASLALLASLTGVVLTREILLSDDGVAVGLHPG
jgi:hypothetical protein